MLGGRRIGRWTRGLSVVAAAAALTCASRDAHADALDPTTGRLVSVDPGAVMIGFEDPTQLATLGVALTQFAIASDGYGVNTTLLSGGGALDATALTLHTAPDVAVEGARAVLLGSGPSDKATGLVVPFAKLSPLLSKPKLSVTIWVRSDGAMPTLTAAYGTGTVPVDGSFTSVTAIRTGRETSDGWTELTTGPIDTSVWGVPLAQIAVGISPNDAVNAGLLTYPGYTPPVLTPATLVVDALEIVPLDGTPIAANSCTIATQDTACGADAECQFGHCLPAYAAWGPTPSQADRTSIVDRWITLAKHVQAARSSAQNADSMVAARTALTATTVGGRQFYAGLEAQVNALRNQHTSYGSPANNGLLQPVAAGADSSTIGACIGFGELDLLETSPSTDKLLGFIVYSAVATSVVNTPLKAGDAITQIDGIDPLTWVRSVYLTYGYGVPSDPGADLAWSATSVAWMISHRASNIQVTRCAATGTCDGTNKTVLTIDVATPAWTNLQGTGLVGDETDKNLFYCSERFQNALSTITPPKTDATGNYEDTVSTETLFGDTLGLQFDGTDADLGDWEAEVTPVFSTAILPTKVLFDVRQGNGGYAEDSELIAEEIRPTTEPVGEVGFYISTWDGSATEASLLTELQSISPSCDLSTATDPRCAALDGEYFLGEYFAQLGGEDSVVAFTPGGTAAKVAWLQAADVSANDYLAALIQGRTNQRVFAPGPTSGSYGTISSTSWMLLGWQDASIQMSDSIWASNAAGFSSQPFRSGVGVAPDEIVAQTMTDSINGVDTMITAAHTWLESTDATDAIERLTTSATPKPTLHTATIRTASAGSTQR